MMDLVPAKKNPFQTKRSECIVKLRQPLRHPVVVGILCLEGKLLEQVVSSCYSWDRPSSHSTICSDRLKRWVAISDQSERRFVALGERRQIGRASCRER